MNFTCPNCNTKISLLCDASLISSMIECRCGMTTNFMRQRSGNYLAVSTFPSKVGDESIHDLISDLFNNDNLNHQLREAKKIRNTPIDEIPDTKADIIAALDIARDKDVDKLLDALFNFK